MSKHPVGFMSYVRFVDEHDKGQLSEFCERLTGEVRLYTGDRTFDIFQDHIDIAWGEQWQQRLDESIDAGIFLIPIITPGYFTSDACRAELQRFLAREQQLGRNDLIFPVYYVDCPALRRESSLKRDPLLQVIADRQFCDWRELRFEPLTAPPARRMLAKMATQIAEALAQDGMEASGAGVTLSEEQTPARQPNGPTEAVPVQQPTGSRRSRTAVEQDPPTRGVDAWHRGDHATLTEALKAAKPGDRILVRPGLYREGIVINKPVEIIGDGDRSEIVIEAEGKDAILFKANVGRVANLTLRQVGGGQWYCVDIAQGRLELEGCDISSQSLACVAIHNGAVPSLRENRIHSGNQSGVFIYDNGQGFLESNDIFENANSGVEIKTGGNPTLRNNRIYNGKKNGVYIHDDGQGELEGNDIFENTNSGVVIRLSGNPVLRNNHICKNKYQAVRVLDGGQGIFEDNDLRDNIRGAWDIAVDCQDKIQRARNQE